MDNNKATALLDAAYSELGYSEVEGISLFNAQKSPGKLDMNVWTEKGDWLALAEEVKAEKIFFMDNNPVAVFARQETVDADILRIFYNKIWSMARPRLLFLAKPGELAVYDLAAKPPRTEDEFTKLKPLEIVRSVAKVAKELARFRREELETGRVFEMEKRFGDLKNRADKALIRDLKEVRRRLISLGLGSDNLKFAHALIGRSIFIRYLEDRGILQESYFQEAAGKNQKWKTALKSNPTGLITNRSKTPPLYPRVLRNKSFTYALFRKLAKDFNGDMFPNVDEEEKIVQQCHLNLIRDLMYGEVGPQKSLFFYAYQFKVIPIELISSIYEEFYHEENGDGRKQGAYYTPPALAEFVLSKTLTPERLSSKPRIIDPACGSGIFLVESFRRIVRYRVANQGRRPRFNELKKVLREQIAGIDINPEAIRVAAFSLYLSLLHYLEPSDIQVQIKNGNRLPNLVFDREKPDSFNSLLAANAFDIETIDSDKKLSKQFPPSCTDIVVGNPPWGSPGPRDAQAREQNKVAMDWCAENNFPVGDMERSQAFIWRALDFLKPDGIAGLLVSTGVFFKHHENTVAFRKKWLDSCALDSVYNFAHTRQVFFKGAISPFAAVVFSKKTSKSTSHCVHYWSSKQTRTIEGMQSIVFSKSDLKLLRDEDDLANYKTWKTYWWGSHRDYGLIHSLNNFKFLSKLADSAHGGHKKGNKKYDADWLTEYKSFPTENLRRYGLLDLKRLEDVPPKVQERGDRTVYEGMRLLIKRGIEQKSTPKGQIIAHLESRPFCFRHSIYGIRLNDTKEWKYKVLLGIFWSSLSRYFFFLTTGNWGIWHDEIELKDALLKLPVCFPKTETLKKRIVCIVDKLREYNPPEWDIITPQGVSKAEISQTRKKLEDELDDAIFELFGLSEAEIDLVRDMCDTNMDFLYLREKSEAAKPIVPEVSKKNFGTHRTRLKDAMGNYLRTFMKSWAPYLDEGTEFHWRIHTPPGTNSMLAVVFSIRNKGQEAKPDLSDEEVAWASILSRLDKSLMQPISSRVYIDGLVRAVSDEDIIIIKRNEKRHWTKSMAREDAEATLVQAMNRDQMAKGR